MVRPLNKLTYFFVCLSKGSTLKKLAFLAEIIILKKSLECSETKEYANICCKIFLSYTTFFHNFSIRTNFLLFLLKSSIQTFLVSKTYTIYTCKNKTCIRSLYPLTSGGGARPLRTRTLRMQLF